MLGFFAHHGLVFYNNEIKNLTTEVKYATEATQTVCATHQGNINPHFNCANARELAGRYANIESIRNEVVQKTAKHLGADLAWFFFYALFCDNPPPGGYCVGVVGRIVEGYHVVMAAVLFGVLGGIFFSFRTIFRWGDKKLEISGERESLKLATIQKMNTTTNQNGNLAAIPIGNQPSVSSTKDGFDKTSTFESDSRESNLRYRERTYI